MLASEQVFRRYSPTSGVCMGLFQVHACFSGDPALARSPGAWQVWLVSGKAYFLAGRGQSPAKNSEGRTTEDFFIIFLLAQKPQPFSILFTSDQHFRLYYITQTCPKQLQSLWLKSPGRALPHCSRSRTSRPSRPPVDRPPHGREWGITSRAISADARVPVLRGGRECMAWAHKRGGQMRS